MKSGRIGVVPGEPRRRASEDAPALPLMPGPGGHEGVIGRAIGIGVVGAVASDRAVHQARVRLPQLGIVDAERRCRSRREALDDHVGPRGQGQKAVPCRSVLQIDDGAALPPVPDPVAGKEAERISPWRFDLGHPRAVVRQQHRGDRPSHAPRKVQYDDSVPNARHFPCLLPIGRSVATATSSTPAWRCPRPSARARPRECRRRPRRRSCASAASSTPGGDSRSTT